MEPAKFSSAKLADVDDRYYFGVTCQDCMRSARISLVRLRSQLGDDYPVVQIRTRLKCSTCGSKQITTTFLAPHQAVSNLASLFNQEAR